jgi:hypothetical protein
VALKSLQRAAQEAIQGLKSPLTIRQSAAAIQFAKRANTFTVAIAAGRSKSLRTPSRSRIRYNEVSKTENHKKELMSMHM